MKMSVRQSKREKEGRERTKRESAGGENDSQRADCNLLS